DRLVALPHRADRADGDRTPPVHALVAAPGAAVDEPEARLRRGSADVPSGARGRDPRDGASPASVLRRRAAGRRSRRMSAVERVSLERGRLVSTAVLIAVAGAFLATLVAATGTERLAADFHASYLQAAESLRDTGSPYGSHLELPYVYP